MSERAPVEYYLTHVGGLEEIVCEELAERLPRAKLVGSEYGRQIVRTGEDPRLFLSLRTIENVYVKVLGLDEVPPEAAWLDELEALVAGSDFAPALATLRLVKELPPKPSFRVTAERLGKHEYRSPEIAGAVGAGVVTATGWRVDLTGYDLEVRVDVREQRALVGVRLTEQALHKRSRVVHPRVTVNPTVAAAMVRLSRPQPGQLVVDPMLGGGTLLTERYLHDERVWLLGGDLFPEKTALARQNFEAFGIPASIVQWDAQRLPLRAETVDVILCNPPWGNLVGSRNLNRRLYPRFLAHCRRVLKPGGRIVLLTSERALVARFVKDSPEIRLVKLLRLSVGGLVPSVHVLEKAPARVLEAALVSS